MVEVSRLPKNQESFYKQIPKSLPELVHVWYRDFSMRSFHSLSRNEGKGFVLRIKVLYDFIIKIILKLEKQSGLPPLVSTERKLAHPLGKTGEISGYIYIFNMG